MSHRYNLRSRATTPPVAVTGSSIFSSNPQVSHSSTIINMADAHTLTPAPFYGRSNEDVREFLANFALWAKYRKLDEESERAALPLLLKEGAAGWYSTQPPAVTESPATLKAALKERYDTATANRWRRAADLWQMRQSSTQSLDDFVTSVELAGQKIEASTEHLFQVAINGLRPALRQLVVAHDPQTLDDLRKWGRLAECSQQEAAHADQDLSTVIRELAALREDFNRMSIQSLQVSAERRTPSSSPRRVTFSNYSRQAHRSPSRGASTRWGAAQQHRSRSSFQPASGQPSRCNRCAGIHLPTSICKASNQTCYFCGKVGHFRIACRSIQQGQYRQ